MPWIAIVVTLAVLLTAGTAVNPVRDAATLTDVGDAYLVRPFSYVLLAPLSDVLDTLTLISVRQDVALVLGAAVLLALWRSWRAWRVSPGWRSHVAAGAGFLLAVLVSYAAAAALPRPMARLEANDANVLVTDFHAHTSASHDVRSGWDVEASRRWHADAGYDVFFVSDHGAVAQAERGLAANPGRASDGVVVLQGIEVTWAGEHVNILDAERTYRGLLTENHRDVDETALGLASFIPSREPVVIWNHPRDLNRLPIASGPSTAGVRAIEIVNGSPADMDRVRAERSRIAALAESRDIAVTTGSDNHGWGRAAPGWTLLRIIGWRGMAPDSLETRIERALRESGFATTRALERRVADPGASGYMLAATIFTVPARMLTTLSMDERIAWIAWSWVLAALAWRARRRRAPTP